MKPVKNSILIKEVFASGKWILPSLFAACVILALASECYGQIVPDRFGDNPSSVKWRQVETDHFVIVFPQRKSSVLHDLIPKTEKIYQEYRNRLGTAPAHKITLYYNDYNEIICGIRAQNTDADYSIWTGDPLTPASYSGEYTLTKALRIEIAYAFQAAVESFPIDYWYYLFSQPSRTPWSDGLISFLALPYQTPFDISTMRYFYYLQQQGKEVTYPLKQKFEISSGRSQIQYFRQSFGRKRFADLYSSREEILSIPYFDFDWAFHRVTGVSYEFFEGVWFHKISFLQVKSKNAIVSGDDRTITPFLDQKEVRTFSGIAVSPGGDQIAAATFPESGSYVQELRVISQKRKRADQSKIIAHGYFKPQMDWNSAGQLAFAKRYYDSRNGDYYYQINIWNEKKHQTKPLESAKNAQLPAFSPDGHVLAYIKKTATKDQLWIENLANQSSKLVYTFDDSVSVTQIDYHPEQNKLLVSYEVEAQKYGTGLLELATKSFTPYQLQSEIPLNARWSPDGTHIYFNSEYKLVPNIFRAAISGSQLRHIAPVTSQIMGAELMDVTKRQSGGAWLAAKSGDKITFYPGKSVVKNYAANKKKHAIDTSPNSSKRNRTVDFQITPYHSFANLKWEPPFFVPYYFNPNNFGIGTYLSMIEPIRTHKIDILGLFSAANFWDKSYFHTSYVNNSFKPQIKLDFDHLSNTFTTFGVWSKVRTLDAAALSSLWKLSRHSQNFADWYGGVRLRYLGFDYFSDKRMHAHHPDLYFANHKTKQTDIKVALIRRKLEPSRNTIIHPLSGNGARLMVTASDKVLGSQTKYARISLDGYKILPAFGDHRIFLYANGVMDAGVPAGRDYLSFTDNGGYALPESNFMGSIDPAMKRFVRGYKKPVLGDRFIFGKIEYRIPFMFNTTKKLFGVIPPARTSLDFFVDGGIMGDGRISADQTETSYRYSTGIEIKHILGFGKNFKVAAETGIAQPLNQSLQIAPYFKVQSAIPF